MIIDAYREMYNYFRFLIDIQNAGDRQIISKPVCTSVVIVIRGIMLYMGWKTSMKLRFIMGYRNEIFGSQSLRRYHAMDAATMASQFSSDRYHASQAFSIKISYLLSQVVRSIVL